MTKNRKTKTAKVRSLPTEQKVPNTIGYGQRYTGTYAKARTKKIPAYDRKQLKALLPLRLPEPNESRSEFESELDARLAGLALEMDCTWEECVGLAMHLGEQGWAAFSFEFLESHQHPTGRSFTTGWLIAALDRAEETAAVAAKRIGKEMRAMGIRSPSDESLRTYVATRRASSRPESAELSALYHGDESKLPKEHVARLQRLRIKHELRLSGARMRERYEKKAGGVVGSPTSAIGSAIDRE